MMEGTWLEDAQEQPVKHEDRARGFEILGKARGILALSGLSNSNRKRSSMPHSVYVRIVSRCNALVLRG